MRLLLAIVLLASLCSPILAAPPELSAEEPLVFDANTQSLLARGDALFVHDEFRVEADEIRFFRAEARAEASGNVRITRPGFRLVTNELTYHVDTRTFRTGRFRAGYPPLLAEGESLSGHGEELTLRNVTIFLGEPGSSVSPNIFAEQVVLRPDDRIIAVNASPAIGDFRLFRVPSVEQPFDAPPINFSAQAGYRGNLGAFVQSQALIPLSESFYAGGNIDVYTERGLLIGPAFGIRHESEDHSVVSEFSSGWIADQGDTGRDYFLREISDQRWFLNWRHLQTFRQRTVIRADLNFMSDAEVFRDFRDDYFDDNPYPDAYVEALHQWDNVVLSFLTRFETGGEYATVERLPEVRLDLLSSPLPFAGLYHTGFISAARLKEHDYVPDFEFNGDLPGPWSRGSVFYDDVFYDYPPGSREMREGELEFFDFERESDQFHFYYGLARPIDGASWLTITPRIGAMVAYYPGEQSYYDPRGSMVDEPQPEMDLRHFISETGFDIRTSFFSEWDYKNRTWEIDGLRHLLQPVIYFRSYDLTGDEDLAPLVNAYPLHGVMPPVDLRQMQTSDAWLLDEPTFVRFGLENLLQTRANEGAGSRNLLELNLYQDLDIDREEWGPTYAQLIVEPAPFISFGWETGFELEDLQLHYNRARLGLQSANVWQAMIYADYLDDYFHQYAAEFWYRLSDSWTVGVGAGYDVDESEFDRQSLTLVQRLDATWEIRYRLRHNTGARREDDWSFSVSLRLMRF